MSGPERSFAPVPSECRERAIDQSCTAESVAAWASDAVGELLDAVPQAVADNVAAVACALMADALANGLPPLSIRVTATTATVDVAVTGGGSIGYRTLSQDAPALVEARRLTTGWTTRLGPGGRGSVVTASIPLRPRRRFPWPFSRRSR